MEDNTDEFIPSLNQLGEDSFNKIVDPPSGKDKNSTSTSASATSTRFATNPRDDFILRQHAQHEYLKQIFLLVGELRVRSNRW